MTFNRLDYMIVCVCVCVFGGEKVCLVNSLLENEVLTEEKGFYNTHSRAEYTVAQELLFKLQTRTEVTSTKRQTAHYPSKTN